MKKFLTIPTILLLLLVLFVSPGQAKNTPKKEKLKKKIISLMPYMQKIAEKKGASFQVDLTDAKQYTYVMTRLAYSGKTEKNSPKFYASLEQVKEKQATLKELGLSTSYHITSAGQSITQTVTTGNIITNHHSMSAIGTTVQDPGLIAAQILSTVEGGTEVTFLDIILTDENHTQLLSSNYVEVYAEGTDVRVTGTVSHQSLMAQFPDAVGLVLDSMQVNTINGVQEPPHFILVPTPIPEVQTGFASLSNDNFQREEPTDKNADGVIMLCLNRSHADCDYPQFTAAPNEETYVRIPFKGQLVFNKPITKIYGYNDPELDPATFSDQTGVYVYTSLGGTTVLDNFSTYLQLDVNTTTETSTISWDVPREEGVFANAALFARYENVHWFLKVNVQYEASWNSSFSRTLDAQFSSSTGNMSSQWVMEPELPPLKFAYSCIAAGTQIRLADGRLLPIEKITNGMTIQANGAVLPVADTSVGIEIIPMVRLTDDKGNSVLLTESHPVLTVNRGIIWAGEVKEGDRVRNENGTSLVRSVTTEMFDGKVYNVKLDMSTLKEDQRQQVNAIYANDILVGDLDMQAEFEFKNQEERKDVLSRLPQEWHQDYLNSLNR